MSTNFPTTSLDTFPTPASGQPLSNPNHITDTVNVHDAIIALETKVGVNSSSVTSSLDYIAKDANSNGGGHVQTPVKGGTGQITYAKGDILVAQSSSVLAKLGVGANGSALIADSTQNNGVKWGSGNTKPTVRVYGYSSSVITWIKPSVLSYIFVELVGGGGGGGGSDAAASDESAAGGGGSGGYSAEYINAASLSPTEDIYGGAGGAAGAQANGLGGTGGTTTFGAASILYSTGGSGGEGAPSGNGGAGGQGFNGEINFKGDGGGGGMSNNTESLAASGKGGASRLGGGGQSKNSGAGEAGGSFGGGGSGAASTNTSAGAGGVGAPGVVIITEY